MTGFKKSAYIGLGSNVGDRLQNLQRALKEMAQRGLKILKTSPVYENPALLPPTAPAEWNKSFLNAVCEINPQKLAPAELLKILKTVEQILGRKKAPRWSPRVIDLDILLFADQLVHTPLLKIPHTALKKRNFVLAGLKDLNPLLKIPLSDSETVLSLFRSPQIPPLPTLMQIVNLTPDSFSDGGKIHLKSFKKQLLKSQKQVVAFWDLGAESTGPGAKPLTHEKEWRRLKPYMELFKGFYEGKFFRPRLSIDTRHVQTAQKALSLGADLINDVSGLSLDMLKLLKTTGADYVLTHSLTVPASREHTLPLDKDPVEILKKWLEKKLHLLERHHISLERVIFDPGIGFGKTAQQSLEILNRIREFYVFPVRIMVGHSRKSFMQDFAPVRAEQRDWESVGVSLKLSLAKVDILRVHRADLHARTFRGFRLSGVDGSRDF